MTKIITLAIIEDHPLYINGLRSLLISFPDIQIVALGQSVKEGMDILAQHIPHVMLIDIDLPDGKGIRLLEHMVNNKLTTRGIILSMYHDYIHTQLAEERGASGYLPKNTDPDKLIYAIRTVSQGNNYFEKPATQQQNSIEKITRREKEVLELLSEGKSREAIADTLCISPDTLKSHIKNLVLKTNTSSVTELITGYLQSKI
jgi:DNA-binding NarL/FixJ family response regulator